MFIEAGWKTAKDFSVAQAFRPGGMKGGNFKAPLMGLLKARAVSHPRRKRLG
jgi:hypothetical protein